MKLANMEMSQEERDEYSKGSIAAEQPKYSWGLQIRLDDGDLEKLGIKELPKVGEKLMLTARVEVCSAGSYETVGQDAEMNCSLQITDMAIAPDQGDEAPAEKALYGEKK